MAIQFLIRLPNDLANRFRSLIPARQRNQLVAELIEAALADREAALERLAVAVTAEERDDPEIGQATRDLDNLAAEGLDDHAPPGAPPAR